MTESAAPIACPYFDGTLELPAATENMVACGRCGLELPDTEFYKRTDGRLRRECKAHFKAGKNARADADRDHYRKVAPRSYVNTDGAGAKRQAREANPGLYAEIAERYESANRDRHKKRYYQDVDATRAKNRAAYQANRERYIAASRRWLDAHPAEARLLVEQTRARRLAAPGTPPTPEEWVARIRSFDHRCAYCFKYLRNPHQDHVVALSKGGTNDIDNVVPAGV